jgi:UDP-glucose 4-epimerase
MNDVHRVLVTGGWGFIGSHTVRALLAQGHRVVVPRRRPVDPPAVLAGDHGDCMVVEDLDVSDLPALLAAGRRHQVTEIVHLAAADGSGIGTVETLRANTHSLLNVFTAAQELGTRRVLLASTLGVYAGVDRVPFHEDQALPTDPVLSIPVAKKSAELFGRLVAEVDGIDVVSARISTIWGPGHRNLAPVVPRLVHAAVHGRSPDHGPMAEPAYADDGRDLCYVDNCASGLALLATTARLRHRVYNVGDGRPTKHAEVAATLEELVPGASLDLPRGRDPSSPGLDTWLDISRLADDTGYRPEWDLERGLREYVEWLRAGHPF